MIDKDIDKIKALIDKWFSRVGDYQYETEKYDVGYAQACADCASDLSFLLKELEKEKT